MTDGCPTDVWLLGRSNTSISRANLYFFDIIIPFLLPQILEDNRDDGRTQLRGPQQVFVELSPNSLPTTIFTAFCSALREVEGTLMRHIARKYCNTRRSWETTFTFRECRLSCGDNFFRGRYKINKCNQHHYWRGTRLVATVVAT